MIAGSGLGLGAALSLGATAISLIFAAVVYQQFVARRRSYQLVWSLALLIFGVGTFCQFVAEEHGWNEPIYRIWYYSGAMLAAAYLGQGTVYLMAPRALAHGSLAVLIALSLEGLALALTVPVDLPRALVHGAITGGGFPSYMLFFVIPLNAYGTITLVGGALWSVIRFWPDPTSRRRATGTLLIAVGGLIEALGGTANRLGIPGLLYVTEMIGVAVIFVGYLQTVARTARAPSAAPSPASTDESSRSAHPLTRGQSGV